MVFFLLPILLKAQSDTIVASQKVYTHIVQFDSTGMNQNEVSKSMGKFLPYLVLYNLTWNNISIKISADKKKWIGFGLNPMSKHLFRCKGINQIFIVVDTVAPNPIKKCVKRNIEQKIFYNNSINKFDITNM